MQDIECQSLVRILHQLPIFLGKSLVAHMPTVTGITAFTNLAADFFVNTSISIFICHSSWQHSMTLALRSPEATCPTSWKTQSFRTTISEQIEIDVG
jgi:hypothetical protein